MANLFRIHHFNSWTEKQRQDVREVVQSTTRDEEGISYDVSVSLHSMSRYAYEEGEDQVTVWSRREKFGATPALRAGGSAFVALARDQAAYADGIAALVWPSTEQET
jgi:hypothetical protein